ncbi:DUF3306 domain-containing protein [Roseovarius salinarum]|uniref:DUF3306 domain-containing protein n=1 Tax=Roseovarius salinarum TaxID=1981892 RepID=UPI000C33067E|nr:DUF3306 domain-containing protein [Roseovarius salinarum]
MTRGGDFWSRRKARVREEEHEEARALEARAQAAREAELEEKPDEVILEELDLPDPDTLAPGDDFKAFMARAVPERIRRRALRRLWLSNPALANLDGLVDYGEDYTDAATVIENLQTVYQVGKGMFVPAEETAQGADSPDDTTDADPAEALADADDEISGDPLPETEAAFSPEARDEDTAVAAAIPRRRLHFSFDDHAGGDA